MRYGIFSDVHGNWEALQAVITKYKNERIDGYCCLGDIVGYGADPGQCIDCIQNLKPVCIAGNHDWAVLGKISTAHFNPVAKTAVEWTRGQLSKEYIQFLNSLELTFKNDDFVLVHGALNEPEQFHYMVNAFDIEKTFSLMDRPVCFVGHSHIPQVIVQNQGQAVCLDTLKLTVQRQNKYIVNVGGVGQPRDGNPMAAYCVYDSDTHDLEIKRTAYDIKTTQQKILKAGLPEFLAQRLSVGR